MRRLWIVVTAALTLFLASAPASMAARAEVGTDSDKYAEWSILYVTAAPGERNNIVVTPVGQGLWVSDSGPVTAGGNCAPQPGGDAVCHGYEGAPMADVRIDAGDLDDSVRVEFWRAHLSGGAGDDVLSARDEAVFIGGTGDDLMVGGPGTSHFIEGSAANGSDVMVGGNRSDPGLDSAAYREDEVSYAGRENPIRADLEGDRDDGEPGERDQIGSDVESIEGGAGADILTGSAVANWLNGGSGADVLTGGAGDDSVVGGRGADKSADRLLAGPGFDYVSGGGGNDRLYGGSEDDEVRGGSGRDRIRPGSGTDRIFGGPGNDNLWTRDGFGEDVVCGGGWDRVVADFFEDGIKPGCERVLRRPSSRG